MTTGMLAGITLTAPAMTLLPAGACAKGARIEPEAIFDSWIQELSNRQEFLNSSVAVIRLKG